MALEPMMTSQGRENLFRRGAPPVGVQPKDMLYIRQYGTTVYVPGTPSPQRSKNVLMPAWYKATLVPALLRQPYQDDTYSGRVGAPGIPRSKPGFVRQSYRDRRFGNETSQYMNLKAPAPTWNGIAPGQRVLPVLARISAVVPGGIDSQY